MISVNKVFYLCSHVNNIVFDIYYFNIYCIIFGAEYNVIFLFYLIYYWFRNWIY